VNYGQVNAEPWPVMTGNEPGLTGIVTVANVLFAATNSRVFASICLLTNYFITQYLTRRLTRTSRTNVLTKFAYRLSSVASHHVGVVVCVRVVWGAGWCGWGGCGVEVWGRVCVGTPLPTQNLKSTRCSRFVLHGVTGV